MLHSHLGEAIALITAICWTLTALSFEQAGKRIGSLSVNLIRLVIGFLLIGTYTLVTRGMFLPLDATNENWLWLMLSGVIGFVVGDLFLFQAYVEIGSRISLLIMATSPPITALLGFILMGEKLNLLDLAGMFMTMGGIAIVILVKGTKERKVHFSHPVKGLFYAFMGSLGQAVGLICSKYGMQDYDAFAATQIRIIAAIVGFVIVITIKRYWNVLFKSLRDFQGIKYTFIGAVFGPFLGVSLSLLALKYTSVGIASTITSISPILIIPISILIFREKITLKEILGAVVTILGVSLLFL